MDSKTNRLLKKLNPNKIIIPIVIGIGVNIFLSLSNEHTNFDHIVASLKEASFFWVTLAIFVLLSRDGGYMYRIRHLTGMELSWKPSFFVILLWEFASAITPSVVGGTAIAVFIMNREKIPFGKSLAYVLLTAVLDNLFFVFASLMVIFLLPFEIFPSGGNYVFLGITLKIKYVFIISVSLIAIYTFIMAFGLFMRPRMFKKLLVAITSNKLLKRWRRASIKSGNEMIMASKMLMGKNSNYWFQAILSTVFIWSARYFMLNCLIAAFTGINASEHLLIFARQIIMWIVMLISPTPGATGAAEGSFVSFFSEFFPKGGFTEVLAFIWRLLTYYAYLIIGAIILPKWIKRVFGAKRSVVMNQ